METLLNFIQKAFAIQTTTKMFHWRTHEHSRHVDLDEFYNAFSEKLDEFVESYQGKYDKLKYGGGMTVEVLKFDKTDDFIDFIRTAISDVRSVLSDDDGELVALLDDMRNATNKLKMKFTMK